MMISPDGYVSMHRNDSFKELIKERKSLEREISRLEKLVFEKNYLDEEWMIRPGPDVLYQMNLEYLAALCLLIRDRYREEFND